LLLNVLGGRQIHVLLSYTCASKKQIKEISNLSDCLRRNNFSVSHEENESHNLARDKLGWLDGQFYRVLLSFIIIIIIIT